MFFQHIDQLMTEGIDLTLVIRKTQGQLTVSLLPRMNGMKDHAQNHLVPFIVSGTPIELDTGFLNAICRPVQRAAGLLTNMAQFEKAAEKAVSNSKPVKEQKTKEDKATREKREKYEKAFKKAEELFAAKNYDEALTSYQQARLYASEDKLKDVDEKIAEVRAALNQGSLFDLSEQTSPAATEGNAAAPASQPAPAQALQPQPTQMPHQQPMPVDPQTYPHQGQVPVQGASQGPQQQTVVGEPQAYQTQGRTSNQMTPQYQPWQGPSPQYQPGSDYRHPGHQFFEQGPGYMQGVPPMPQQPYTTPAGYPQASQPQFASGMPPFPDMENGMNYRPEEYASYPDFPDNMLRQPYQPTQN